MKKRICALILALGMLITSASALTVDQTRDLLREYYIDEIPEEVLAHETIDEIISALGDPYTEYYTAAELAEFYAAIEDVQIVGIGIRSYYRAQGVEVTQVAPGGPAEEGGIQAGDWIIAIDGRDTRGAAENDVDTWIRGGEGTRVTLTVLRDKEIFDVTLTRQQVIFPTAQLEKIEDGIGWISCTSFGSNTFEQFYQILTTYDSQVNGWIVDLRGNTGGNALTAVLSAGCFGGWNSGVYMRDGSDRYYAYLSTAELASAVVGDRIDLSAFGERGYLTENTVCVLTDESTASAAELFSVVVRDSGAGLIIGTQTYGKGVAQTLFTKETANLDGFFDDGDGLKVTSERCFSRAGSTYDQVGVFPHVLVHGDLADEVAALLMAPYVIGDDALILRDVCRTSSLVQHFVIPLELLRAQENAQAAKQLFSSLTPGVTCQLRREGELWSATMEEAAEACGVTLRDESFPDVEISSYADDIEVLRLYGIVGGDGNGMFRPGDNLTRAEMCALLVKAMRYPVFEDETSAFSDVDEEEWYAPYINAMYRLGLVNGDGGLFRPKDAVTHEEFLVLLGRVAQWLDMGYYELMKHDGIYGDVLPTKDGLEQQYGEFHAWAREEIWLCDGEYVWAELAEITPEGLTTREEAARSIYRMFCCSGLLSE